MARRHLTRRISAYLNPYFTNPSHQKYLFYLACILYVTSVSVVVVLEPFLPLPCEDDAKSELEFLNSLYKHSLCGHIRHPALLFMTRTECLRGRHLLMAVFLGGVIGYERRTSDRPAGIRTMALVSLGSALFTINSTFGFLSGPMSWDSSRVSAAIPSGVGFLGGGLIVKSSDTDPVTGERHHLVQGITTAAATWLSAAVGISCGGGMYSVASFATALNLLLLRFGPRTDTVPENDDFSLPDFDDKDVEGGIKGTEREPLVGGTELIQKPPPPPPSPGASVKSSVKSAPRTTPKLRNRPSLNM